MSHRRFGFFQSNVGSVAPLGADWGLNERPFYFKIFQKKWQVAQIVNMLTRLFSSTIRTVTGSQSTRAEEIVHRASLLTGVFFCFLNKKIMNTKYLLQKQGRVGLPRCRSCRVRVPTSGTVSARSTSMILKSVTVFGCSSVIRVSPL